MNEITKQVEIIYIGENSTQYLSPTLVVPADIYESMKAQDMHQLLQQHMFNINLPFMVNKQIIPETKEYYYKIHQPITTLN